MYFKRYMKEIGWDKIKSNTDSKDFLHYLEITKSNKLFKIFTVIWWLVFLIENLSLSLYSYLLTRKP